MNSLTHILRQEIHQTGSISFARFMDLALYHPVFGYYEKELKLGREGDFYTAVQAGPLFGRLLAFEWSQWLENESSETAAIVEGGAHEGQLAKDILAWFKAWRPDLLERLHYIVMEPSVRRRRRQEQTLVAFLPHVRWFEGWDQLPENGIEGIIFCNELLDAMPAHRLQWNTHRHLWQETGVTCEGDRFVWTRLPAENPATRMLLGDPGLSWLTALDQELLEVLPDGFTVDIAPAAFHWWSQAASKLRRGRLVAFDYGLDHEELLQPHRHEGTLRGYRSHRPAADPLADPGEQDLTAHIDFSSLRQTGEGHGLSTLRYEHQSRFLTAIAARLWKETGGESEWDAKTTRQFQTLTNPAFLGHAFRVLDQRR